MKSEQTFRDPVYLLCEREDAESILSETKARIGINVYELKAEILEIQKDLKITKTDLGTEYLYEWRDMAFKLVHTSHNGTNPIIINEKGFDEKAKQAFSNSIALEMRANGEQFATYPGFVIVTA